MKALMISIKPKNCAKIMNGKKTIEVRRNKGLYKAIQKLIDEQGFADIYVYCTFPKKQHELLDKDLVSGEWKLWYGTYTPKNGKVIFKFRCYKVEEMTLPYTKFGTNEYVDYEEERKWQTSTMNEDEILKLSCLTEPELYEYLVGKNKGAYAIHINDLEIFNKPKELSEFRHSHCDNLKNIKVVTNAFDDYVFQFFDNERCNKCKHYDWDCNDCLKDFKPLTKAPQSWCYVEDCYEEMVV